MVTRRFTDEGPTLLPRSSEAQTGKSKLIQRVARPSSPKAKRIPRKRAPRGAGKRKGASAHIPRTLSQVLNEADELVVSGDLSDYVPLPTGFTPPCVTPPTTK